MELTNIIWNQQNYIMLQYHLQHSKRMYLTCENMPLNFIQKTE